MVTSFMIQGNKKPTKKSGCSTSQPIKSYTNNNDKKGGGIRLVSNRPRHILNFILELDDI